MILSSCLSLFSRNRFYPKYKSQHIHTTLDKIRLRRKRAKRGAQLCHQHLAHHQPRPLALTQPCRQHRPGPASFSPLPLPVTVALDPTLTSPLPAPSPSPSRPRPRPHPRPHPPLCLVLALILTTYSPLKHISLTPRVCLRLVERRRARGELASHPAPEGLPRRRRGQLEAGPIRGGGRAWEGTLLEGLDSGSDRCEEVIQLGLKRDTACNAQRHRSIYPHLSHPSTHPPLQLGYGRPSRRRRRSCTTSLG